MLPVAGIVGLFVFIVILLLIVAVILHFLRVL